MFETFLRSPRKSIRRACLETQIPPTTVWRVTRKRLRLTPYNVQHVQALRHDNKMCKQFYVDMQEKLREDEFEKRLIFTTKSKLKFSCTSFCDFVVGNMCDLLIQIITVLFSLVSTKLKISSRLESCPS